MTEPEADPSIAATFTCSRCGRPAARVAVVPAGQPLPAPVVAPSGFPPASTPAFDTFLRVVIDAVGLGGSMAGSSIDAVVPRVRAALEAGDAAALYAANLEIGRFWCPACAASYCGTCWRLWDEFDPEEPSWFEEQRGECPRGHERMIID